MMTIFKYALPDVPSHRSGMIDTMEGKILSIQLQDRQPFMWVLGDPKIMVRREIILVGTGWDVDVAGFDHIGTLIDQGYVWHYFARVVA